MLSVILLAAMFAGCLAEEKETAYDGPIDFIVYYDITSGTILETLQNNQQDSETGVDVVFDFSYTKSNAGDMSSFWLTPGDGSNPITVLSLIHI